MPDLWQLVLLPFALIVSALLFEANIWCLYGYVTFRENKYARLSFRLLQALSVILMFLAILAPWGVLVHSGLWAANTAWIVLSFGVFLFIYFMGRFVEWRVEWFFDIAKDRHALRDVAEREQKMFQRVIHEWPSLESGERRKFFQTYLGYPLHMREVFFIRLLDSFPVASESFPTVPHYTMQRMKHWAGAAMYNNIEAALEIRHRLDDRAIYEGPIPDAARHGDHPDTRGQIIVARTGHDEFVVGPKP